MTTKTRKGYEYVSSLNIREGDTIFIGGQDVSVFNVDKVMINKDVLCSVIGTQQVSNPLKTKVSFYSPVEMVFVKGSMSLMQRLSYVLGSVF